MTLPPIQVHIPVHTGGGVSSIHHLHSHQLLPCLPHIAACYDGVVQCQRTWQGCHTACPAQHAPHQGLKGQYKADDEGVHILDQVIEACVSCSSQGRTPSQLIAKVAAQQVGLTQALQRGRLSFLDQQGVHCGFPWTCAQHTALPWAVERAARSPTIPGMMAR